MAVLMPRLTAGDHLEGRFHAAAWRFALRHLETLSDAGHALERDRCGAIQLAADAGDEERLATIAARGVLPEPYVAALTAAEASEIAGATLPGGGLFFPQGGWLAPGRVCGALASCAGRFIHGEVAALRRADGALQVIASDGGVIARADAVILAAAVEVRRLADAAWLPLTARRGQLSLFPATRASARLRTVVAAGGYVTPAARGRHAVGATFDWVSADGAAPEVVAEDHDRNLAGLGPLASQLFGDIDPAAADGRAGLRCMTPDHLPVAGPLPDHAAYLSDYGALRHGQPWRRYPTATYQPGIYVLSGLGARGLVTAPLAAEVVACHITGEPWPLEWDLVAALHPARFLVRDLKRLRA
jgi:tRNA 5-methylaminomethyl-2-thiouridine biosynthesis bifunctional protein